MRKIPCLSGRLPQSAEIFSVIKRDESGLTTICVLKSLMYQSVMLVRAETKCGVTKQKMATKKYKKCYITNESQRIDFYSVEECLKYLHASRMQFSRHVNSCKTLNGFSIRMLS